LVFMITAWASFLVSRLLRFLLEEDVYQHLHLEMREDEDAGQLHQGR
jgi:hypothetical protein